MTASDLVRRLRDEHVSASRHEAADMIEAQAREIARLKALHQAMEAWLRGDPSEPPVAQKEPRA